MKTAMDFDPRTEDPEGDPITWIIENFLDGNTFEVNEYLDNLTGKLAASRALGAYNLLQDVDRGKAQEFALMVTGWDTF